MYDETAILRRRLMECANIQAQQQEILGKMYEAMLQKNYEETWNLLLTVLPLEKRYELREDVQTEKNK